MTWVESLPDTSLPDTHPVIPVGRRWEFQCLTGALFRSMRRRGNVVTLAGPTMAGKTELLCAFTSYATERGALVLSCAGTALEKEFPFGIVRQLLRAAPFEPHVAEDVAALLDEVTFHGFRGDGQLSSRLHQELCMQILQLAENGLLVLSVDDVHDADAESLEFLLFLVRRIQSVRVLVVTSERQSAIPANPSIYADLGRQEHFTRIELGLLPPAAVAELISQRMGTREAASLAREIYMLSGGNPLLVAALLEDQLAVAQNGPSSLRDGPVVGEAFGRGVVRCLHRMEPTALHVAQALAISTDLASPEWLGELLEIGIPTVTRILQCLGDAGIVSAGPVEGKGIAGEKDREGAWSFRHPKIRSAVTDTLTRDERSRLDWRVALLLHSQGAPDTAVARHLLAAGDTPTAWALPVLQKAAEQAATDGELGFAIECLKQAWRRSEDEEQRAGIHAAMAGLEWLLDPAVAIRHLPGLVAAVNEKNLTERYAMWAVRYFAWYGRVEEAIAALRLAGDAAGLLNVVDTAGSPADWLASWYPGRRGQAGELVQEAESAPATAHQLGGSALLLSVIDGSALDVGVRAERILHDGRADAASLES